MKSKAKLPSIKKEIKDFLLSEEGKITKKDIVKIGMSLAVLSMLFTPETAAAGHHSGLCNHQNYFHQEGQRGGHHSLSPHCSHSSHGSHGQW
jgi:hypothetical protein